MNAFQKRKQRHRQSMFNARVKKATERANKANERLSVALKKCGDSLAELAEKAQVK